ncbi:hypothetical protein IQ07DRAFT_406298 [Pyrenochaeta sp. DS3sAY3a]|nr:hypothetical protein IQ07DRAFT_406298 [Pyrenochaeta sp. DS3sAY3a]
MRATSCSEIVVASARYLSWWGVDRRGSFEWLHWTSICRKMINPPGYSIGCYRGLDLTLLFPRARFVVEL